MTLRNIAGSNVITDDQLHLLGREVLIKSIECKDTPEVPPSRYYYPPSFAGPSQRSLDSRYHDDQSRACQDSLRRNAPSVFSCLSSG